MKPEPHRKRLVNCVYVLLDPRKPNSKHSYWTFKGEPFYVGRSSNLDNRFYQHTSQHWQGNPLKEAVLRKIKTSGLQPIVVVLRQNLSIDAANLFEKKLIALVGRRTQKTGPLVNLTDGGDGGLGHKKNEATKRHLSDLNAKRWLPSHLEGLKSWSPAFVYCSGYRGRCKRCTYNCLVHGKVTNTPVDAGYAITRGRTPCPECGKVLRRVNVGRGRRGEELLRTTPKNHERVMRRLMETE